ncbi:MAG TPA: hypothetical protein VGM25_10680 [Caulobacteraceae bacterium]|jgi:hypothetical protein
MSASVTVRPALSKMSTSLLALSIVMMAGLAGCESPAPPPPPPPPPPVAVAPPPPPVLLPRNVVELASVYEAYVEQAGAINAAFTGADNVAASLKTAEHYQTDQFQRGQTAYGAIVALQDKTFVAALREFAKDPRQRAEIAAALMKDPSYAATFKGADSAAGLVIGAFSDKGHELIATGSRIRQAAYDVQHQSWSKGDVADRPGRLALAKSLSAEPQKAVEVATLRLSQNASGAEAMGVAAPPATPPYTPLVSRSLAVAAMAAIGEGGDEYSPQLTALLADTAEAQCLHLAKLNLYQCLSVAKPHYEDVFCLGQHAVSDTGQCMMKGTVAGYVLPPLVPETKSSSEPVKQTVSSKGHSKKKSSSKAVKAG